MEISSEQIARRAAAKENKDPEIVPIVVRAGGGSFHHGRTWHGSGFNASDRPRRSLVVHAIPANVKFVREKIAIGNGPVYGRYMKLRDTAWMKTTSLSCGPRRVDGRNT